MVNATDINNRILRNIRVHIQGEGYFEELMLLLSVVHLSYFSRLIMTIRMIKTPTGRHRCCIGQLLPSDCF